jgi:hypothetical protein
MAPTKWERLKVYCEWTQSTPVKEECVPELNWRKGKAEQCSTAMGYVGDSKNLTDCNMKCNSTNSEESPSEGRHDVRSDRNRISTDKHPTKRTLDCVHGMNVVCDEGLHNVQSVKLLINPIKEDIDSWLSALETSNKTHSCP